MEARLRPINAVLALATAGDMSPAPLAADGFRVAALEVPVGIGANRVVIDVLLKQDMTGLLIACESKSGANIDATQAAKYVSLDAQAVVLAGSVDLPDGVRPAVGVLYACQAVHAARIEVGLGLAGVAVPILAVDRNEVRLVNAEQAPDPLSDALGSGPIGMPAGIPRIIPCDHESPLEVVRPQVRTVLVAHLSRRTPQVAALVIAHETLTSLAIYGKGAQGQFQRTINTALRLIAKDEPDIFQFHPATRTRDPLVTFLRTPEDNDPRGRAQGYQALARQGHTRRRTSGAWPGQLDLLQEVDPAETVGVTDDDDTDREDRA